MNRWAASNPYERLRATMLLEDADAVTFRDADPAVEVRTVPKQLLTVSADLMVHSGSHHRRGTHEVPVPTREKRIEQDPI